MVTVRLTKPSTTIIYDDVEYTCGDTLAVPTETAEAWKCRGRCEIVVQSSEEEE